MSETPQFHPEIKRALDTSGDNIGRVKDIGLAEVAAYGMQDHRQFQEEEFGPDGIDEERINRKADDFLKATIAKRAVQRGAKGDLDNLAITGAFGGPNFGIDTERLVKQASQVADDYDALQVLAYTSVKAHEHDTDHQ